MSDITSITLPVAINWDSKKLAAQQHINKLDDLLNQPANKLNYQSALAEVASEKMLAVRTQSAVSYWFPYFVGEATLQEFFEAWLIYTPTTLSPGLYIEYWDYLVNTPSGLLLANDSHFKPWFTAFLNFHGDWINSTSSTGTLKEWMTYTGTVAHPFDINDYVRPDPTDDKGGFESFNQFFLRNLQPGQRPLCNAEPTDDVVVSPCDGGVFYLNRGGDAEEIRNNNYNLPGKSDRFDLLEALPGYGPYFVGGDLLDILLWFTDYHHFHAPVAGEVIHQGMYAGSYNYDFGDYDPSDFYAPNRPDDSDQVGWYEKLGKHQRYVWIIKTPNLGLVAMVAIGFWGVGSIVNAIEENATIERGQYMGHFGYGGSSIVLAFSPTLDLQFKVQQDVVVDSKKTIVDVPVEDPDNPVLMKVRQCLGKNFELNWPKKS